MAPLAPLTHYGSWDKYTADAATTVAEYVAEFVDEEAHRHDVPGLTDAYRTMIDAVLPGDLMLDGDQFYGPEPIPADAGREMIEAAIDRVDLFELSVLYEKDSPPDMIVVYEDNNGAVYLGTGNGSYAWSLGPVTRDLHGRAAADAHSWHSGDWKPSADLRPAWVGDCQTIATWHAETGLTHVRGDNGERVAGAGGCLYLGMELNRP